MPSQYYVFNMDRSSQVFEYSENGLGMFFATNEISHLAKYIQSRKKKEDEVFFTPPPEDLFKNIYGRRCMCLGPNEKETFEKILYRKAPAK